MFAALFVWLALGMFGLFTIQVPAVAAIARGEHQQQAAARARLIGTAIMGALSSLIVTACVAPPLVASLAVIGQSGDVFRGGAALFALSLGMGAPLLLVGASAGQFLPKAGAWMDAVKQVFGVMLLGVAIWMIEPLLPGAVTLALWAALAFVAGFCLLTMGKREVRSGLDAVRRGFGALAIVYGTLLLIGALAGRSDPLQPLAGISGLLGAGGANVAAAEHAGVELQAHQERRRFPGPARRGTGRRPAGNARFLCRLVRVLQGNGEVHVYRSRRCRRSLASAVAVAGRCHGERRDRPGAAAAFRHPRSTHDRVLRQRGR